MRISAKSTIKLKYADGLSSNIEYSGGTNIRVIIGALIRAEYLNGDSEGLIEFIDCTIGFYEDRKNEGRL